MKPLSKDTIECVRADMFRRGNKYKWLWAWRAMKRISDMGRENDRI